MRFVSFTLQASAIMLLMNDEEEGETKTSS